jgi:hypothetical protein
MSTLKLTSDLEHVKFVVKEPNVKKAKLEISKTLDGNLYVKDHKLIDIVVIPEKGKIVCIPKGEYSDEVYVEQDKVFDYLMKNGVVTPDSIIASNIYGSLEAKYNIEKLNDEEPIDVVVYNISMFIQKNSEENSIRQQYIDDLEKELLHPDREESTELGEIPQEKAKGSIPKWGFPSRGVYRYNY